MENILYTWKFEDKKNRSQLWYIIALSVVIGLTIWGFLTKQYGMSFIILLISGLVYFVENNSDDEIEVKVTEQGLYISNVFYDYSTIKKYSVGYQNDSPNLLRLHLSKASVAILDLKISAEILSQVQFYINDFIENGGKSEITSTDKLIRFLNL